MYLLLSPTGETIAEAQDLTLFLQQIKEHSLYKIIAFQLKQKPKGTLVPLDIKKELERQAFFSSKGCATGVTTLLPKATWLEHCIQYYNQTALQRFKAVEIEFPVLYSTKSPEIRELTKHYEDTGEVFHVDKNTALSYAADPGLFNHLKDETLNADELPITITSPVHFMRNFTPNGAHRRREFSMPDLHTLAKDDDSTKAIYLEFIEEGSKGMRNLFDRYWLQFCDIEAAFLKKQPSLPKEMAIAAQQFTLINILEERPRYYAMRSGLVTDAGYNNVMVYNLQWDDTNAKRFRIQTTNGIPPNIIHATLAGGCARILPALIGQGLAQSKPARLPYFLIPHPITLISMEESCIDLCRQIAEELAKHNIRVKLLNRKSNKLGKIIKSTITDWQPFYAVIGEKEKTLDDVRIQCSSSEEKLSITEWLNKYAELHKAYFPPHINPPMRDLPIVPKHAIKAKQTLFDEKERAAKRMEDAAGPATESSAAAAASH